MDCAEDIRVGGCIVGAFLLLGLSGCGKDEQDNSSYNLSVQQSEEIIGLEENSSIEQETTDNFDNNTMQVYSEAHPLVDYSTVDELLGDACALVKVEVLQANSENVRNYIYTSYDMKVVDVLYGTVDTERYVQWCGRSATQLMGSLLPDPYIFPALSPL